MTKLLIGFDTGSYTFNPASKQVTIKGISEILSLENLLLITNVTDNIILYNFADPTLGATIDKNVITLNYDTTSMSSTDKLQIYVDTIVDPRETVPINIISDVTGQKPVNQAMPVALANEQFYDYNPPTIMVDRPVVGNVLLVLDCLQYRSISLQIITQGGVTAGTIAFEGSNNQDVNGWVGVQLSQSNDNTMAGFPTIAFTTNTSRYCYGSLPFRYFRIRVSASFVGGSISISPMLRMTPFVMPPNSSAPPSVNISAIGGGNYSGVAGVMSVSGNNTTGGATNNYPVPIGGIDYNGLLRKIITDAQGQQVVVGVDPTRYATSNPVNVRPAPNTEGMKSPTELLELILMELKLHSYYLKELPLMLSMPNGYFKEEIKDIIDSTQN